MSSAPRTERPRIRVLKRKRESASEAELHGDALVGIVDSAMIMACADGGITTDELAVVANVIDGFFDSNASRNEIEEVLSLSLEAIERDGLHARMESVAAHLRGDELRARADQGALARRPRR